jgi:hypothetical protein
MAMKPPMTFAEYLELRLMDDPFRRDVSERSITAGMFKAVNPARPVSPVNSRLLSGPFPRKLKSQVVGR